MTVAAHEQLALASTSTSTSAMTLAIVLALLLGEVLRDSVAVALPNNLSLTPTMGFNVRAARLRVDSVGCVRVRSS